MLKAMRNHLENAELQQSACGALRGLAFDANLNVKLVSAGAIDDVLRAMRTHPAHAEIQAEACGVLWILTLQEGSWASKNKRSGCLGCVLIV